MAAIEKIRRHSGLLIAIIGIALLAFVLQDLFQSRGRSREFNIAVVDGEKIPYQDFDAQKEKNLDKVPFWAYHEPVWNCISFTNWK